MTPSADELLPDQPRTIKRGGARIWIHPAATSGLYTNLRHFTSLMLLLALYATPWLKVGGEPFLRLSFLNSSFVMFGSHILIYEFYHFVLMALLLVFTLFMVSALYGRIWCGYACPQTVFVEQIFGRIETFFEGNAAKRLVAEHKPLTWQRVLRKTGKQLSFMAVSASFGFTLTAIFTGTDKILIEHHSGAVAAVLFLTGLAWFDGAYWREQFCHIVCPYGRFQGVMQDGATRSIGYDPHRGEPRKRGKDRTNAGDCIDCGLCVRVCPSGIDIRQGAQQMECIGCAKCVDACDSVMTSIGKPQGLIRYDAVAMFSVPKPVKRPKLLRPRLAVYAVIWVTLLAFGITQFVQRASFHARLLSSSGAAPYVVQGEVTKNLFSVKVGNQWRDADSFVITVGFEGGTPAEALAASGIKIESPTTLGPIAPGQEVNLPVLISAPLALVGQKVQVTVKSLGSGESQTLIRNINGPTQ